jgi:hypothetical protein
VFGRLFGRGKPRPDAATASPELQALRDVIAREQASDPLIAAKVGAQKLNGWVMGAVTTERGVHVESLFVALGALAGFACQMAARHLVRTAPQPGWQAPWAEATGADGRTYHFGDAINHILLEAPMSLWAVAAGTMQRISDQPVPDATAIVSHVAATVGSGDFGAIRYPEGTSAGDTPLNYLRAFWPAASEIMTALGVPLESWPVLFGIAAQENLAMARQVIEPAVALTLFMECAVAMSKVDPADAGIGATP